MLDCGMGATHVNAFLTAMNIPGMATTTIRRHENIVGDAITKITRRSCDCAVYKERQLKWYVTYLVYIY
jgi:hypothetical protein